MNIHCDVWAEMMLVDEQFDVGIASDVCLGFVYSRAHLNIDKTRALIAWPIKFQYIFWCCELGAFKDGPY